MEAIRARLMASDRIVPLGKGKGIVQENLGQTSFRKVSEPPSSKIRRVSESDSSSSLDDIDFLSNATPSPPPSSMLSSKVSYFFKSCFLSNGSEIEVSKERC